MMTATPDWIVRQDRTARSYADYLRSLAGNVSQMEPDEATRPLAVLSFKGAKRIGDALEIPDFLRRG